MKESAINNFIFSNKFSYRIRRHASFWAARILFLSIANLVFEYDGSKSFFENYLPSLKYVFFLVLLAEVPFCYLEIYYLAPKFLFKKKYIKFSIFSFLLIFLFHNIGTLWSFWIYGAFYFDKDAQFALFFNLTQSFLFVGPPAFCTIVLTIKMFKSWYQKQQEKIILVKANADAEIQLLKAQIHPHFLFNTLNNIYSFTLTKSPRASIILKHLNDTLAYMIRDCNVEFVTLQKEIKLIQDYISIEQVRYGNRLDIQTEITGHIEGKKISPLLLIPFVENSFKHGTSKMLERPWVKLLIEIKNTELFFAISNSKPLANDQDSSKKGIGLKNVKKRLALLYPQTHSLTIESMPDKFIVQMKAPLFSENPKSLDALEKTEPSLI